MSRAAATTPVIEGAGALCAVGRGVRQVVASVRAGIGRQARSSLRDARMEPITMALFPESELEPLAAALAAQPLSDRWRRIARLSAPALREAVADVRDDALRLPLFMGLPEPSGDRAPPDIGQICALLGEQAGVALDPGRGAVFAHGRAAALLALEAGLRCLAEERATSVLVGGADTFLDLKLLAALDDQRRILGPQVMDGFVPGEGAAFLRLTRRPAARPRSDEGGQVAVLAAGTAADPGHRYGTEPARGEGLATALERLFAAAAPSPAPVESVFAGFNGESFDAKAWGVARLRHSDRFAPASQIHHPADCFGDVGAATGALLLAIAAHLLAQGNRPGPALVFASSDRAPCACALLDVLA